VHFIPLHHMHRYRDATVFSAGGLPGADEVFQQLVSLPMHQGLTDDEVGLVIRSITESHSRSLLEEVRR
jgi:perosamine synthetase